jgi:hypothetical protein
MSPSPKLPREVGQIRSVQWREIERKSHQMVDCGVSSCDNLRPFCGESDVRLVFGAGDSSWLDDPLTGLVYVPSLITGLQKERKSMAGKSDVHNVNRPEEARKGGGNQGEVKSSQVKYIVKSTEFGDVHYKPKGYFGQDYACRSNDYNFSPVCDWLLRINCYPFKLIRIISHLSVTGS